MGLSSKLRHKYILIYGRKNIKAQGTKEDWPKVHILFICPINEPHVVERAAL